MCGGPAFCWWCSRHGDKRLRIHHGATPLLAVATMLFQNSSRIRSISDESFPGLRVYRHYARPTHLAVEVRFAARLSMTDSSSLLTRVDHRVDGKWRVAQDSRCNNIQR